MNNFTIDQRIIRIAGDYSVYGARGTVVEIGEGNQTGRIRIKWDRGVRTWIKRECLIVDDGSRSDEDLAATRKTLRDASEKRFAKKYASYRR